jgi:hypothetical protein
VCVCVCVCMRVCLHMSVVVKPGANASTRELDVQSCALGWACARARCFVLHVYSRASAVGSAKKGCETGNVLSRGVMGME